MPNDAANTTHCHMVEQIQYSLQLKLKMAQSTEVLKIKFFVNLHKISQIKEVCT